MAEHPETTETVAERQRFTGGRKTYTSDPSALTSIRNLSVSIEDRILQSQLDPSDPNYREVDPVWLASMQKNIGAKFQDLRGGYMDSLVVQDWLALQEAMGPSEARTFDTLFRAGSLVPRAVEAPDLATRRQGETPEQFAARGGNPAGFRGDLMGGIAGSLEEQAAKKERERIARQPASTEGRNVGTTGGGARLPIGSVPTADEKAAAGGGLPPLDAPLGSPERTAQLTARSEYLLKGSRFEKAAAGPPPVTAPVGSRERTAQLIKNAEYWRNQGSQEGDPAARDGAADEANKGAENIFNNIGDKDIEGRKSSEILDKIEETIEEGPPTPPSLTDLFNQMRENLGVDALEDELAQLDADIDLINTSLLVEADKAGERLVSVGEINRRKGTLQKNADRELAFINIERSAVARMLNNKLTTLATVMELTDADFDNASKQYSDTFNRLVTLQGLISGEEKEEQTIFERARDDARLNLSTLQNLLVDGTLTYDKLSQAQKDKISSLEIQAGFPSGLTSRIMRDNPDGKIQSTVSRTDKNGNSYFDVLIKNPDGSLTVQTIYRGASGSGGTETIPANVLKDAQDAQSAIDAGVNPQAVRQRFISTHTQYVKFYDDFIGF